MKQLIFALVVLLTTIACTQGVHWKLIKSFGQVPTGFQNGAFGIIGDTWVYFEGYDNRPCFNPGCPSVMSHNTFHGKRVNATHVRWTQVFPIDSPPNMTVFSGYTTLKAHRKLLICGGVNVNTFQEFQGCWLYDPDTITWTQIFDSYPNPGARLVGGLTYALGKAWVFGGGEIDFSHYPLIVFTDLNDLWSLNIHTGTWTLINPDAPNNTLPYQSTFPHQV